MMERLTFFDDFNEPCYRLGNGVHKNDISRRLAAYEDTGLEPEEVAKVRDAYSSIAGKGVSGSRIQELIRAEQEGRLVVLPCKIGDTVYLVTNGGIKKTEVESIHQWTSDHWKLSTHTDRMSAYWTGYEIDFRGIGKTVFLTREEASAALEALKGGDEKRII